MKINTFISYTTYKLDFSTCFFFWKSEFFHIKFQFTPPSYSLPDVSILPIENVPTYLKIHINTSRHCSFVQEHLANSIHMYTVHKLPFQYVSVLCSVLPSSQLNGNVIVFSVPRYPSLAKRLPSRHGMRDVYWVSVPLFHGHDIPWG